MLFLVKFTLEIILSAMSISEALEEEDKLDNL